MEKRNFGIIGGGLTGLVTAYRLVKAGHDVTIYEASDTLGGLAAGFELAGHRVEKAYHFLYKTDEYILALLEELDLADKLEYHKSSVSTYYDGTLYPMMSPIDLIRFKPLSFINRIRAGVTVLWLQRQKNWRKLSEITALDWLRKYAGRQVSDVIWEPLLRGKFDRYYDKITMSWLWGRVLQRVDSRDAKLGGEALGYFDGGFRVIIDTLVDGIREGGGEIRLNAPIDKLQHDPDTDTVMIAREGEQRVHDRVLATVPSHVLARMISDYEPVDADYFAKLRSIDYLDAAVQVFATPQKITDYYWHNINSPNAPFVVFLSLTALVGEERFDGMNIYYIGDYVPHEHEYMSMDADELKQRWYGELQKIFPDFDPDQIVDDGLFRMRNAQHIVDIGFEENKLVPHETPCPGVLMANFSQIYPMDRGTNYAVRDGNRMAERLLSDVGDTSGADDLHGQAGQTRDPAATRTEPAPEVAAERRAVSGLSGVPGAGILAQVASFFGRRSPATLLAGGAAALVAMFAAVLFVGFEIGERQLPGYGALKGIDRSIERMVLPGEPEKLAAKTFPSGLIGLKADVGVIPSVREEKLFNPLAQAGGGLTAFGSEVLLLPYDGRVYAARSGAQIRATGIRAPRLNRAAYQALAEDPAYSDYTFDLHHLRYNDILYYRSGDGHGLAASYTEFHPERACYTNTLARLDLPPGLTDIAAFEAAPGDWTILHRTQPCLPLKSRYSALEGHMAGGKLAFRAPGEIVMTSGDFHFDGMRSDGKGIAQDRDVEYGKVLSIDIASGAARVLSLGHRNPQGITITPGGEIYTVEHGPQGGDELNRIIEGANYGWPRESFGITYSDTQLPEAESFGRHARFEPPVMAWMPSPALSGLTHIDGFHDAWNGDLVAVSLIEESLHRIRLQDGRALYTEQIRLGARLRDIIQHPDGRLVVWTDNEELIFLTAEDISSEAEQFREYLASADLAEGRRAKLQTAMGRCAECHSFSVGDHQGAPSLARVFGARVASTGFEGYSEGLKDAGGRWTQDRLAAFLADPQGFAPGTSMPGLSDPDPETIDAIVTYLEQVEARF